MVHKKSPQKQKNQKRAAIPAQQVDTARLSEELVRYHEIARTLRNCTYDEIEGILTPITSLDEETQLALLKALSKEQTLDAADVVSALNTFATLKEVRKEARRSLLRLQEARIFPEWTPPSPPSTAADLLTQAIDMLSAGPRRFWKAAYTNSRDIGEIHLVLFWEQGNHFRDVRSMNFLLEFWYDGVKDFFTEVMGKRQAEKLLDRLSLSSSGKGIVECSLAEARQLIQEALEVNKKFGTKPHSDYTRNLPLIRELIWDAPEAQGEVIVDQDTKAVATSRPLSPDTSDLQDLIASFEKFVSKMTSEAEDTVSEFIDDWVEGDFDTAYDLLAETSPLRENLSEKQWTDKRARWYEEAQPTDLRIYLIQERDKVNDDTRKDNAVVDAFWSFEYRDTPGNTAPRELPVATAVYKESGRHWFWTSYTLVREQKDEDLLVIETMTDEGANVLSLPPAELRSRIAKIEQMVLQHAEKEEEFTASEAQKPVRPDQKEIIEQRDLDIARNFQDAYQLTTEAMYYNDGLIAQETADNRDIAVYEQASRQAASAMDQQRCAVYLNLIAERFPEKRVEAREELAELYESILDEYGEMIIEDEESDAKQIQFYENLLEKTYRDAISAGGGASNYIQLAELLLPQEDRPSDEIEDLLLQAQALTSDTEELALIEKTLGFLFLRRKDDEQALKHYLRATELDPEQEGIWSALGRTQIALDQDDEAIVSLQRAVKQDPSDSTPYIGLASVYMKRNDLANARKALRKGLEHNPEHGKMLALLSVLYSISGDLSNAKKYLELAEENADDDEDYDEMLVKARNAYEAKKAEKPTLLGKFKFPNKKKR